MRLISIAVLVTYLAVKVNAQKYQHEHYPFPPQFPTPSPAVYTSDNTLYLPPENHSPLPYFPLKNVNLPYQYLPPTGTKAPALYPTPFPIILSSHAVPSFDDEDDDDDENVNRNKIHLSSPLPPPRPFHNRTQNAPPPQSQYEHKEPRALHQTVSYRHPIDRADAKLQIQLGTFPTPTNQTPPVRRMIISPESSRIDQFHDQLKSGSNIQGIQFLPPPGFISSTTEPVIPILRLSNEMDLDGSFSYEALGADQTHYVQHSRMENMGTEKEEQVVEGSYSYVGDNGQTYTVHYVADSNGFRASGDHLPVAPPVPEIIQRAVQYNLAEEAKRPPHLKSWEDESKTHDSNERLNHFGSLPPQPPQPPHRSLFTGKTPEAFSYSYGSGSSLQSNIGQYQDSNAQSSSQTQNSNLVASASNLAPVKTVDFGKELVKPQAKPTIGPITPQITFLASQGAHVPSINSPQQSISRMFTNTEKSTMPQLMNYEAILKENEPEDSKPLWRWQYGQNANNVVPTKTSISRSSGVGDDVMINFNEMTQEQYTNMIRSQLEPDRENQGMESQSKPHVNPYTQISQQSEQSTAMSQVKPTEMPTVPHPYLNNWYNNDINNKNIVQPHEQREVQPTHPNLSFQQHQPETQESYMEKQNNVHNSFHHYPQESQKPSMSEQNVPQIDRKHPNAYQNYPKEPQIPHTKEQYVEHKGSQIETTEMNVPTTKKTLTDDWFNHENYAQLPEHEDTMKPAESGQVIAQQSRSNLITQKKFIPQSQTVTQSYDYEDNDDVESMFEVRKIKSLGSMTKNEMNIIKQQHHESIPMITRVTTSSDNLWKDDDSDDIEIKMTSSPKPLPLPMTTFANAFKFSDFIVKDESSNFKPITTTKQQIDIEKEITTTTTESIEDIFQNNIFLKNLIRSDKPEPKTQNSIRVEHKNQALHNRPIAIPESKSDKVPKIMNYPNDLPIIRKKPIDISEVLNYVSHKNSFDSGKIKPKSKSVHPEFNHKKETNYYSNSEDHLHEEKERQSLRKPLNHQQQEELRGIIKNYKVLQRNNHNNHNMNVEQNPLRKELTPMPLRMLQMQPNLPPLGRAGPTVKAYLPPIYV